MKPKRKFTVILAITAMILSLIFPGSVFAAGKSIPSKVTLSKVSAKSYNTVNVKWKKASNVTSYAIYYRQSGTKKWTRIATVSSRKTEYTHKSSNKYSIQTGQKYDYTVRGYNSKSKKYGTYNSNGLSVKTLPDTVRLESAGLNADKSVTVRWKASGGADRYVIYRKLSGGSWKRIKTVTSSAIPGSVLSYVDKNPKIGEKNIYTVRRYVIYRKLSGGSWKRIKTVTSSAIPGSVLSYVDKNPKIGEKNIYTVRSYYSKTRTYGKYNSRGISITVPAAPAPTPTPKPENTAKIKAEVVKIVNQERAKVTYGKYNSRGISITVPAAPAPTPTPKPENTAKIKAEVVKIVNQERAKVNLPPLKEDAKIDAAADVRARELKL